MKLTIKNNLFVFAFIFLAISVKGQSYREDASIIEEGYISPLLAAFGTGLNQAWYNTANPQKYHGLNLTLSVTNVSVPTFYYIDNTRLTTLERLDGNGGKRQSGDVPSVFGASEVPYYRDLATQRQFKGDSGLNQPALISMLQVGWGISKYTEIKLRYVPSLNLIGVGLMHDVKQYFHSLQSRRFDLSAFAAYTQMSVSSPSNKGGTLTSTAVTVQGIISKNFINHITGYLGVGYNLATATYDIKNYALGLGPSVPINFSASSSGPRATFGLRLRYSIVNLQIDLTLQKNPSLTLGLGVAGKERK
jgi:hypothetical protein